MHRDVNPASVSLADRGREKVLDLGLTKRMPMDAAVAAAADQLGTTAATAA